VAGYEFSDSPASGDSDAFDSVVGLVEGMSGLAPAQRIELLAHLQSVRRKVETQPTIEAALLDLLVDLRGALRSQRQFELADKTRDVLAGLGVEIGDSPQGSTWSRKG
jgi:cysteinyl-tRNA synthetase